jgi:branched-chain amino acid aminotransferase
MTAVYGADEIFLTGTGAEVVPVVRVDDRTIGDGKPGPVTRRLIEAFRELVNSQGVEIGLAEPALR